MRPRGPADGADARGIDGDLRGAEKARLHHRQPTAIDVANQVVQAPIGQLGKGAREPQCGPDFRRRHEAEAREDALREREAGET